MLNSIQGYDSVYMFSFNNCSLHLSGLHWLSVVLRMLLATNMKTDNFYELGYYAVV